MSGGAWQRFQQSRRKGARLPPGVRSVARPWRWGNPFQLPGLPKCREVNAILTACFRVWVPVKLLEDPDWLEPLRPYRGFACYCPPDWPCHVDVLIEALAATAPWEPSA